MKTVFTIFTILSAVAAPMEAASGVTISDIEPTPLFSRQVEGQPLRQLMRLHLDNPAEPLAAVVCITLGAQAPETQDLGTVAKGRSVVTIQVPDIRVFPCWPQDKDASFTRLRAQGGFLVTAEQKVGKVVKLEITSTIGGKLRVLSPWTGRIVERDTSAGESVAIAPDA